MSVSSYASAASEAIKDKESKSLARGRDYHDQKYQIPSLS